MQTSLRNFRGPSEERIALTAYRAPFRPSGDLRPLVAHSCARYGDSIVKTEPEMKVDRCIERRAFRRFQLLLPVLFRWTDSTDHYDVGRCGNAGLGGMFILSASCPPVGTQVEIELNIPAFDLVPRQCQLLYTGRVMRVEACYRLRGFAVAGQLVDKTLAESISMVTAS